MRCDDRRRNHSRSGTCISSDMVNFCRNHRTHKEQWGLKLSMLFFHKADRMLHLRDLRVRHKRLPDQPATVVLNHDRHWGLIQTHGDSRIPVLLLVERIAKSVDVPDLCSQIAIEMFQRQHGLLRGVGKGADGSGRCDRAIVCVEGLIFVESVRPVNCCQTPRIRTVPLEMVWIRYAVCLTDKCLVAIVVEVVCELVSPTTWVVAEIRVVGEEEWTG